MDTKEVILIMKIKEQDEFTGKKCNYCDGDGRVVTYTTPDGEKGDSPYGSFFSFSEMDLWPHEVVTCRVCDGVGWVTYGKGSY